jgi:hypothetical protein
MGINYCDAMMYWKAKERGIRFDKVLTLGHQTLCLHPSEVTIFRDAYRKAFESPSGTPLDEQHWRGMHGAEFTPKPRSARAWVEHRFGPHSDAGAAV